MENWEKLLTALLNCGWGDLKVLLDLQVDWSAVVEEARELFSAPLDANRLYIIAANTVLEEVLGQTYYLQDWGIDPNGLASSVIYVGPDVRRPDEDTLKVLSKRLGDTLIY